MATSWQWDTKKSHVYPAFVRRGDMACVGEDPELFYPGLHGDPQPAIRICRVCPVRLACLAFALKTDQRFGIWGGTTPRVRGNMNGRVR